MKEIVNKFIDIPGYICFGCAPNNECGLKMKFFDDNGTVVAKWVPDVRFTGYHDIVHGGIQATIIDEAAAWAVDVFHARSVVTVNLNVNYHKPLKISEGDIYTRAKVEKIDSRYAEVFVEILKPDQTVATSATVKFRIIPEKFTNKLFNKS